MRTIHIGIGHDDDLVVAKLGEIELLGVFLCADGHAERCVDILDLSIV